MTDLEYLEKYLKSSKLEEGIKRLESGEPVQYIVGNVDFYGNTFDVNKNVLIPRFETEGLVEKTLKYINMYFSNSKIVDLGTGSGCIAVTLKKALPNSIVDAVDISKSALEVAISNSKKLNADVNFIQGDMLKPLNDKYDVIISNPPYIAYDEEIMDIVKNNEPHMALYASNSGLKFYEDILRESSNYLNERSIIAFEIGETQGEYIKNYALKYFNDSEILIEKDIYGRDRYVFILNNIKV